MHCIKTGFYGLIRPYDMYVYGDAFVLSSHEQVYRQYRDFEKLGDGILLLRICERVYGPAPNVLHIDVEKVDHWFDDGFTSPMRNSTLIAPSGQWKWLGYDGKVITDVDL